MSTQVPETMHAIVQTDPEDPNALVWQETPTPALKEGEVLLHVRYAGLNRADTHQARGHYPPPAGTSEAMGLEAAGTIVDANGATKPNGEPWKEGEEVAALLAGGAYAEYTAVPHGQLLPIPKGFSLADAASVVEVAATVWSNIFMTAHLKAGDVFLIHGGGGGIGLFAIQLAKAIGATVAVTASSPEKLEACKKYGADILINYKEEDFVEALKAATDGHGADIILDIIGAAYLDRNLDALAYDGHLAIIGLQGGSKAELKIGKLLGKRGTISATGLRYRTEADKARIVEDTVKNVWPLLEEGKIIHHIDRTVPIQDAAAAHQALLDGDVTGKLVFEIPEN